MIRNLSMFAIAGFVLSSLSLSQFVSAQTPFLPPSGLARLASTQELDSVSSRQAKLIYLLQGERRKISKDFVAQLDGDRLRISLEDRGLVRTSPDRELLVSLIDASGRRLDRQPDADGQVVFDGVQAGFAALVVTANALSDLSLTMAYAAIPVFMVAAEADAPAMPLVAPLAEVEPQMIVRQVNEDVRPGGTPQDITDLREFELVPFSRFRVQRLADGSIEGRVVVPQNGYLAVPGVTELTFQRDGTVISRIETDEEGFFVAENIPVGPLSLIATGPSGHAAYAIEVFEFQAANGEAGDGQSRRGQPRVRYVSQPQQIGRQLLVVLIPPALMEEVQRLINERLGGIGGQDQLADGSTPLPLAAEEANATPGAGMAGIGGRAGGFGGAGGGAYGGFGGGGAALGAAGLATAIAALATNDDDGFNANVATPISR
jgi:hypothetical protein